MKVIAIALVVIVVFFVILEIHEEIDWLYHCIARLEIRIETLESEKENTKEE